jgi:hypothetical protein
MELFIFTPIRCLSDFRPCCECDVGFTADCVYEHVVLRKFAGIVALPRQQLAKAAHEFIYAYMLFLYICKLRVPFVCNHPPYMFF